MLLQKHVATDAIINMVGDKRGGVTMFLEIFFLGKGIELKTFPAIEGLQNATKD